MQDAKDKATKLDDKDLPKVMGGHGQDAPVVDYESTIPGDCEMIHCTVCDGKWFSDGIPEICIFCKKPTKMEIIKR